MNMLFTWYNNISGGIIIVSVGDGRGERCYSQSNLIVGSVEDNDKSFKETHAEDEAPRYKAETFKAHNNQINFTGNTAYGNVEVTRPDLSVRNKFEYDLIKKKKKKC